MSNTIEQSKLRLVGSARPSAELRAYEMNVGRLLRAFVAEEGGQGQQGEPGRMQSAGAVDIGQAQWAANAGIDYGVHAFIETVMVPPGQRDSAPVRLPGLARTERGIHRLDSRGGLMASEAGERNSQVFRGRDAGEVAQRPDESRESQRGVPEEIISKRLIRIVRLLEWHQTIGVVVRGKRIHGRHAATLEQLLRRGSSEAGEIAYLVRIPKPLGGVQELGNVGE
jgi:hypothetical protein